MRSSILGAMLPLILLCSPPFSAWTWITSINIIDAFHLGLVHPSSYHNITYFFELMFNMFCVSLYFDYHPILSILQLDMFFCYSLFNVYPFFHKVVRKATKIFTFIYDNTWVTTERCYKKNTKLKHSL